MSGTKLDPIVADVRRRAEERRKSQSLERLKDLVREDSWRRERFLAGFKKGEVAFIAEMPVTTTGKVIRRLLRARG